MMINISYLRQDGSKNFLEVVLSLPVSTNWILISKCLPSIAIGSFRK